MKTSPVQNRPPQVGLDNLYRKGPPWRLTFGAIVSPRARRTRRNLAEALWPAVPLPVARRRTHFWSALSRGRRPWQIEIDQEAMETWMAAPGKTRTSLERQLQRSQRWLGR